MKRFLAVFFGVLAALAVFFGAIALYNEWDKGIRQQVEMERLQRFIDGMKRK